MKKCWLTAITMICLVGLSAAAVSAQAAGQSSAPQPNQTSYGQEQMQELQGQANPGQEPQGQAQTRLQVAAQVRGIIQQIREQRAQIMQLRAENRSLCEQLRNRLRVFREEGGEVEEELASRIREQVRIIREERRELGQTLGEIRGFSLDARAKRAAGEYEALPGLLQRIVEVQQNRIRLLRQINSVLQELLAALE